MRVGIGQVYHAEAVSTYLSIEEEATGFFNRYTSNAAKRLVTLQKKI